MNKKLMAFAVAAALAAPAAAFAQASNVTIYGRANLGLDSYSATGATGGANFDYRSRTRVFDAGSRLGVRGEENLGGGLKAVFLIETGVNIDTGNTLGQSGAPNSWAGALGSRLGHVGLQGNWGLLTFGKSNVWWGNDAIDQVGVNYIAAGMPTFFGSFGRGMSIGVSRQTNTVQYTSPVMSGVNVLISYSPGAETQPANANTNGRLWAATVQGRWGGIGAGYDWVKMTGNSPAAGNQAASTGHKLRAGFFYQPGGQISLLWINSVQDNGGSYSILGQGLGLPAATLNALLYGVPGVVPGQLPDPLAGGLSLSQTSWGLSWEHAFGNVQAFAQWAKVNNISGCVTAGACTNTNATSWALAARYNMSKRTGVYVQYTTISNGSAYNMDYALGSLTSANISGLLPGLPATSIGVDPRMFGVGVMHNF